MGRGKFHQLREGHQLEVLRRLRRRLPERQQLAVDAVHRERTGEQNLHRNQVHHPGLFPVSGERPQLQGDLQSPLL